MRKFFCVSLSCALLFLPAILFAQAPIVSNFSPTSAFVTAPVTITGSNFDAVPGNNAVYFGATRATVTSATTTQLVVAVPEGTTYDRITVTNLSNGLTGYSIRFFNAKSDCSRPIASSSFAPPIESSQPGISATILKDMDGDGKSDIISINPNNSHFSVSRNVSVPRTISLASPVNVTLPAGSPTGAVAGDIDGDGKPDLVTGNASPHSISIYRSTSTPGTISFAPNVDYTTGDMTTLALGDLDGDGRVDIAAVNYGANTLSIFRNTSTPGNVSFAAKVDFPTGTNPRNVLVGDLDSDGLADLAVVNYVDNTVSIYKNTSFPGMLSLTPKMDYATGTNPGGAALGDLNNDGRTDLGVVSSTSNALYIFRNTSQPGNISFAPRADFSVSQPSTLSMADYNGDGLADPVVSRYYNVSVFQNTSTSNSISLAAPLGSSLTFNPGSFSVGDLDGDRRPEILLAGQNKLSITRNLVGPVMTGTMAATTCSGTALNAPLSADISSYFSWVATDNANTTGENLIPDTGLQLGNGNIITNNSLFIQTITYKVTPIQNLCDGATQNYSVEVKPAPVFSSQPSTTNQTSCVNGSISALSVSANALGGVWYQWYHNTTNSNSGGTLINGAGLSSYTPPSTDPGYGYFYAVAGAASSGCKTTSAVSGLLQVFSPPNSFSYDLYPSTVCQNAPTRQLSYTTNATPYYQWYSNTTVSWTGGTLIPGATSNSFTPPSNIPGTTYYYSVGSSPCGAWPSDIVAVNVQPSCVYNPNIITFTPVQQFFGSNLYITGSTFDAVPTNNEVRFGDKKATVISASTTQLTVQVPVGAPHQLISVTNLVTGVTRYSGKPFVPKTLCFKPLASNSFAPSVNFTSYATAGSLRDIDGDEKSDLLAITPTSNALAVARNTSAIDAISLAPNTSYTISGIPVSIATGDFDGDLKPDVVTANSGNNTISVLKNQSSIGTISLSAGTNYPTGSSPVHVAIGDVDSDGKLDIAVANSISNTVSIFRNESTAGTISFAARIDYATGSYPRAVTFGDLDDDGTMDLIVANFDSNTISVFKNTSTVGSISFASKLDYTSLANPVTVTAGDVDQDGKTDITVLSRVARTFSIFRNTGASGSISLAASVNFTTTDPSFINLTGSDVNGDGMIDFTITTPSHLLIYENISSTGLVNFSSDSYPQSGNSSPIVGDVDGDGRPEVTMFSSNAGRIAIMLNKVGPALTSSTILNACSGVSFSSALSADQWATFTWVAADNPNTTGESLTLQNNATLDNTIVNNLTTSTTVAYTVTPNSYYGNCTGNSAIVTVNVSPAPLITAQPSSAPQTVCLYGTATPLSVAATASSPLTYQWYSNTTNSTANATPIPTGTAASYTPPANTTATKYYFVIVKTSASCPVTSDISGPVYVVHPPTLFSQPSTTPKTICQNQVFPSLIANTPDGNNHQWYANSVASNSGGTAISGATGKYFTPPSATPGVTYYYCMISNSCGATVTSGVTGAHTVNAYTSINTHPSSAGQNLCQNAAATPLTISASGSGLTYQWYSNTSKSYSGASAISGATSTSYTPPTSVTGTSYYYATVIGTCNGTVSSMISGAIAVGASLTITSQPSPVDQSICQNTPVTPLTLSAAGGGTITYQWYSNTVSSNTGGTAITGAVSATYTPSSATPGITYYYAVLTNGCVTTASSVSGAVNVQSSSGITAHPSTASQALCQYSVPSLLTVSAASALSHQWYSNSTNSNTGGTPVPGATQASFAIPTTSVGTFYFYAVVTFSCGSIVSNVSGAYTILPATVITTNPAASTQSVCLNGAATALTVTASGSGTLQYYWYSNSQNGNSGGIQISGANQPSYTPPSGAIGTKYYYAIVTGGCSTTTSNVSGAVIVNPLTAISVQPSSAPQAVCQNASTTPLSVSASGASVSYQWYSNAANSNSGGTPVSGATTSSYALPSSVVGTRYYYVVISGSCGNVTSTVSGGITVNALTAISVHPSSATQTVCYNASTTALSVTATGTGTIQYQWYSNTTNSNSGGAAINGATGSSYSPPSSSTGTKYYYVTVTSGCGAMVTSAVSGAITITPSTTIDSQPSSATQTVCQNAALVPLSVSASGIAVTYQWYSNTGPIPFGGTPINGATSASYTPSSASAGTLYYYAVASGSCGAVTSSFSGAITVNAATTIASQPSAAAQTLCQNAGASTLTVTASGSGVVQYQWHRNTVNSNSGGTSISGANASTYTPPTSVMGTLYYYVTVTASCGTIASSVSGPVMVNPLTAISTQPSSSAQAMCQNALAIPLSVSANGTAVSYQWYSNTSNSISGGTSINGANASSFTPPSTATGTLYYYAKVTGSCGTLFSTVSGAVTINALPSSPGVITGASAVCGGITMSPYYVTDTPGTTYLWEIAGGTQAAGGNSSLIQVNWGPTGPGNVSVIAVNSAGCTSAAENKVVTINTTPSTPAINGVTTTCIISEEAYSVTNHAGSTYDWVIVGGQKLMGGSSNVIQVDWIGPDAQPYVAVSEIGSNGCVSLLATIFVTLNPRPFTSAISGSTSLCPNTSGVTYSVTNNLGSVYGWTIYGGSKASGGTTNAITVDWGGAGSGAVYVTETNSFGCHGNPKMLNVNIGSCGGFMATEESAIYPNPANNELTIQNEFAEEIAFPVNVYTEKGDLKQSTKIRRGEKQTTIDTSLLSNGYYLIEIKRPKRGSIWQRVLILHKN